MELQQVIIDWSLILPIHPLTFLENVVFGTSEFGANELSSVFIYSTISILCIVSLLYILPKFLTSYNSIKRLRSILKDYKESDLVSKREDIKNDPNLKSYEGKLWNEFDETLVISHDRKRLYNTLDASYFFNTSTLAKGITESRLIAAVPGFLTGIGVLGTFVGLQMGMGGINLDFSNSQELTSRVVALIKGATVAFSTSVWGIFTSLVFNLIEKLIEVYLRKKIHQLQDRIDFLYPRKIAEQTLVEISEHSKESRNTMSKLAEQIGSRMQEALDASLGPAISQLVNAAHELTQKQGQSSEKALAELVERFIDSISKEGEHQRKSMENGAGELNQALQSVGNRMNEFMDRMDSQLQDWQKDKDEQTSLTDKILEHGNSLTERSEKTGEIFQQTSQSVNQATEQLLNAAQSMERVSGSLISAADTFSTKQMQASELAEQASQGNQKVVQKFETMITQIIEVNRRFGEISNRLQESSDGIGTSTTEFLQKMEKQLSSWEHEKSDYQAMTNNLIKQGNTINQQANESQNALSAIAESISGSSENMKKSSQSIELLGEKIKQAADTLSYRQIEIAQMAEKTSSENLKVTSQLQSISNELYRLPQEFKEVSNNLEKSSKTVVSGFNQLNDFQKKFLDGWNLSLIEFSDKANMTANDIMKSVDGGMKAYKEEVLEMMNEYKKVVNDLLSNYSDRVQGQTEERLNEWNKQTLEFSTTLTDAVNSMNDILGDIDEKLRKR